MENKKSGIEEIKPTPSTDRKVHPLSCGENHALEGQSRSQCTNAISTPVSNRDAVLPSPSFMESVLPSSSFMESSHKIVSGPSVVRAKKETLICSPEQSTAFKLPVQFHQTVPSKAKKPLRNSDGSKKIKLINYITPLNVPAVNQVHQRETVIKSIGRVIKCPSDIIRKPEFINDTTNQQPGSSKAITMKDKLIIRSTAVRACEKGDLKACLNPEFYDVLHPSVPPPPLAQNSSFLELPSSAGNLSGSSTKQQQSTFPLPEPQPSTSLPPATSDPEESDMD